MAVSDLKPLYYSVRQVIALLGGRDVISAPTIRRLINDGEMPATRVGKFWLIPRAYIHRQYAEAIRRHAALTPALTADGRPVPTFPEAQGGRPSPGEAVA